MNAFNRIVMVLGILLWLAVAVCLMLYPLEAVDLARANLDYFKEAIFGDQFFLMFLIGLGVFALFLVILLWLEVRRPRRKSVRITTKGGGAAQLGVESIVQSLEYRIDELAGVRKVSTDIQSRGRDVAVGVDLDTSPSVNIPVLTSQIVDLCHDIVEGQLGVKIHGKVQIRVTHEPYPRGTMPPTGPLGEEAVNAPKQMVTAPPARGTAPARETVAELRPLEIAPSSLPQDEETTSE